MTADFTHSLNFLATSPCDIRGISTAGRSKAMERTVTVWGKPHAVMVKQAARTAFTAVGTFRGELLTARGHSAAAALAAWSAGAKARIPRRSTGALPG